MCDKKKLIKAHIIPDWAYKDLKEQGHMVAVASHHSARKIQSGFWDDKILCRECDNHIIGRLDTYAAKFFNQSFDDKKKFVSKGGKRVDFLRFNDSSIDFKLLKLFFISMVYRASISKRKECAAVSLGTYEGMAKRLILGEIQDDNNIFEIITLRNTESSFSGSVMHFRKTKHGHAISYVCVLKDFEAVIKVSKQKSPIHKKPFIISPDGFITPFIEFEKGSLGRTLNKLKSEL